MEPPSIIISTCTPTGPLQTGGVVATMKVYEISELIGRGSEALANKLSLG